MHFISGRCHIVNAAHTLSWGKTAFFNTALPQLHPELSCTNYLALRYYITTDLTEFYNVYKLQNVKIFLFRHLIKLFGHNEMYTHLMPTVSPSCVNVCVVWRRSESTESNAAQVGFSILGWATHMSH